MWDEPNTKIRCQRKYSSGDPRKGVDSSKQQDGGHGSRHPLRSVQQHTCRMNRPRKWMALKHILTHRYLVNNLTSVTRKGHSCLLYTSPSPRDLSTSRMPSSA
eukprot:TRINITY_DN613_c0_g1_i4.p4 TRINITY_DN613_c0_g1~~TRINITY_DN613_c0_g1_i4.p4  ORF type:complete len:103 (-),score=18.10 TRINITY_DN613_c0_g1_i4:11-319(-)